MPSVYRAGHVLERGAAVCYPAAMTQTQPPFPCPCCGFPSLPQRGTATCDICWWELLHGAGQDDDTPCTGPNHGYSLNRARANVAAHGHMYDRGREIAYLKSPAPARRALMAEVEAVRDGLRPLDRARLAALLDAERHHQMHARLAEAPFTRDDEEAVLRALLAANTPKLH